MVSAVLLVSRNLFADAISAPYARAVFGQGYDPRQSTISLYPAYSRDLMTKRQGATYETDCVFHGWGAGRHLHVEGNDSARHTDKLPRQVGV